MPQRNLRMEQQTEISWPLAKIASAWAVFGITTWQEAAGFVATIYTLCLLAEWLWKKMRVGVAFAAWRKRLSEGEDAPPN